MLKDPIPSKPPSLKAQATQQNLLRATKVAIDKHGYAGLSTREVATQAGVPVSQIHYHFGSKKGLVLALFDYENDLLLERQRALFDDPHLSLSEQWFAACDYFDEDIESGYVRVLLELAAAGWSDPEIAEAVRARLDEWLRVLRELCVRAEQELGSFAPLRAEDVALLIANAFAGAEVLVLLKMEDTGTDIRRSLRSIGAAIQSLEQARPRSKT